MGLDYALIGFLAVVVGIGMIFFVNAIKDDTKNK